MPAELIHIILIAAFFLVVVPAVCVAATKTKGKIRILVVAISLILTGVVAFRWGHFVGYDHSAMAAHWNFVRPFSQFCKYFAELQAQGESERLSNSLIRVQNALDNPPESWRAPVWKQTSVLEVIQNEIKE
ncbi:MAG: hypothetical protein NT011_05820 [Kiritimatiellaeota bacterium]|nr:hypothetical protein [Kiritimatiellota bacterium]